MNTPFSPGIYLVGDIKTFAMREDLKDLQEGVHTLEDGAVVALYKIPDNIDLDGELFDQDNNSYSVASGYVGVIRLDYLPLEALVRNAELVASENDYDPRTYAVVTELEPFTTSKGNDPERPGVPFYALGYYFLSPYQNPNAIDNDDLFDVNYL